MGKSIGIDLGTTNSVMALRVLGTDLIPNREGDLLTPSIVAYSSEDGTPRFIGRTAKDLKLKDLENTVSSIKRLMGRSYSDKEVQDLIEKRRASYSIVSPSRGTNAGVCVKLSNGREYTPQEISSEILKKMKSDAEFYLKDEVTEAVITVPAYFNEKQKHATYLAAHLANFKTVRLLSEPSAAAICYGIDECKESNTILIYDFGGGTLDISILSYAEGSFMEQAKGGDMWLGGDDIDALLGNLIKLRLEKEMKIPSFETFLNNLSHGDSLRLLGEIQRVAEMAKIKLSQDDSVVIEINSQVQSPNGSRIWFEFDFTREEYEKLLLSLVQKSNELVRRLLESIYFTPDMIDQVLMVGGSSSIPCFQKALQELFGVNKVKVHERPMYVIAEGAAIMAKKLSGSVANSDELGEILYRTAHDYYLELANGEKLLLVEKQTPLPVYVERTLKYEHPSQLIGHFNFFSKENEEFKCIGDLWLSHFPEHVGYDEDATTPELELKFKINEEELIQVDITLKGMSGVSVSKIISRGGMDEKMFNQLHQMIQKVNKKIEKHPKQENLGFNLIYHSAALAQSISKEYLESKVSGNEKAEIENKILNRINLVEDICLGEENYEHKSTLWNEYLNLDCLTIMNDFFQSTEKLKTYRAMVKSLRSQLMEIDSIDEIRENIEACQKYIEEVAPKAPQALFYSQMMDSKIENGYHKSVRLGLLN